MFEVDLPEELKKRLENLAVKTNHSIDFYMEEAVRAYLDTYEKAFVVIAEYEEQIRNGTLETVPLEEIMQKFGFAEDELEN